MKTPGKMAESLFRGDSSANVDARGIAIEAICADRKIIAKALIMGHNEVCNGGGSGKLCKLIESLGYRWDDTAERWVAR